MKPRIQHRQSAQAVSGPTHIKELTPDPKNRRAHNPRNIGMVVDALQQVGAARSIVIDENGVILAGNGVTEAAAEAGITKVRVIDAAGDELIAVRRSGLSDEQKRYLAIADNRTGELATWNSAQFKEDLEGGLDFGKFFTKDELAAILAAEPAGDGAPISAEEARATLGERFGVPPFSVLDARQGYWQDRKRAWLALGIESELGRGGNLQSLSGQAEDYRNSEGAYAKAAGRTDGRTDGRIVPSVPPIPPARQSGTASPGGSARPAMRLKDGHTQRGDGRGRPIGASGG